LPILRLGLFKGFALVIKRTASSEVRANHGPQHKEFLLVLRRNAHCAQTDFNSRIRLVNGSLSQLSVWIDCPTCGRYQKLVREVELPFEVVTPMLERACAVYDHCRGLAVMCLERKATRLH